jgi:hypothetical protein
VIGWQLKRPHDDAVLCTDGEWRTYIPMGTPGSKLYKSPAGAAAKARTLSFVTEIEKVER